MDTPIRPRVRVKDQRVWVPPIWRNSRVLLKDGSGEGRDITDEVMFGGYTQLSGVTDAVHLEEAAQLRLTDLSARVVGDHQLAVQVQLAGTAPGTPVSIVLTLTGEGGQEIGSTEVLLGRKAGAFTVELSVPEHIQGPCRLKATLCFGDQVLDNRRTMIDL